MNHRHSYMGTLPVAMFFLSFTFLPSCSSRLGSHSLAPEEPGMASVTQGHPKPTYILPGILPRELQVMASNKPGKEPMARNHWVVYRWLYSAAWLMCVGSRRGLVQADYLRDVGR
jgi:hypothetical protein